MHFWNQYSIHRYGTFAQVKTQAWINNHWVKQNSIRVVCHSQTKKLDLLRGTGLKEGKISWCPKSQGRLWDESSCPFLSSPLSSLLWLTFIFLCSQLLVLSSPSLSLASFFYLSFLVFLLSFLLLLPLTVCPFSSLCLWPYHWLHLTMGLKTSHFFNFLDSGKS